MASACPCCACTDASGDGSHALLSMVLADDLDSAMVAGLCEATPCESCERACNTRLLAVRDDRLDALAARERFRTRNARIARLRDARERERTSSRRIASAASGSPALPASAADALARALAKASGGR